ncbi:LytR C-terminal domain-containing protein [Naumannella huperziae]
MDEPTSDTAIRVLRGLKTPLTLLALLALLFVGFRVGYDWLTAPPPPPEVEPCEPQPVTDGQLKAEQVTVRVFNAGGRRGLAAEVTKALQDKGFVVASTSNYEGDDAGRPAGTMIVGAAPDNPEVQLVAGFFRDAEIVGDGRADRSVEIRVGEKYPGFVDDAANRIDYAEPQICLPQLIQPGTAN